MKACEFESLSSQSFDALKQMLPLSINLAQSQISRKDSLNDIVGDIGDGALPYYVDIYYNSGVVDNNAPNNIKILNKLFVDYKRPGITLKYLCELFYVYKLSKDYGAQALSPEYVDFAVSCYNNEGCKINHKYVVVLRELRSREAYILISKDITLEENITVRVSYKINNNNPKSIPLTYDSVKGCYYYDPDDNNYIHELSVLANADAYCFYISKKNDPSKDVKYLPNSFTFNIVKIIDSSTVITAPQTGNRLNKNAYVKSEDMYNVALDKNPDDDENNDDKTSKVYLTENGSSVIEMIFPDINDDGGYIKESNVKIPQASSTATPTAKLMFNANDISLIADYFRQLYDTKKEERNNDQLTNRFSTPNTADKYRIEFYPLIDIAADDTVYLGTRYLEENAFFYDPDPEYNKINAKLSLFNCDFESTAGSESSHKDDSVETSLYRFNSMDQFEVYKFEDKNDPFGIKIPVESDELYDENNKPKLFDNVSLGDGVIYEIVPRYDNQMFASISFKWEDTAYKYLTYKNLFNNRGVFNHHSAAENETIYLFYKGLLYRYPISLKNYDQTILTKDNEFSNDQILEFCLHIPYEYGDYDEDYYKYTLERDIYEKLNEYCDKNIFRDGYYVNKHDIGLNVSNDISSTDDNNIYIYEKNIPVCHINGYPEKVKSEPVVDIAGNIYHITSSNNTTHYDSIYSNITEKTKIVNTNASNIICNTSTLEKYGILGTFEEEYIDVLQNNIENTLISFIDYIPKNETEDDVNYVSGRFIYKPTGENIDYINLTAVSSIRLNNIDRDRFPVFVYSVSNKLQKKESAASDKQQENETVELEPVYKINLIDILYSDNVYYNEDCNTGLGRFLEVNNNNYYMPFYYGSVGDEYNMSGIFFRDVKGHNINNNISCCLLIDNGDVWEPIDNGDGGSNEETI